MGVDATQGMACHYLLFPFTVLLWLAVYYAMLASELAAD